MKLLLRNKSTHISIFIILGFFFSLDIASASTIARPMNNDGLVGYWGFDFATDGTTVIDRSGKGNDGTLTNATGTENWTQGKRGNGLQFDGDNDYVDAGNFLDESSSYSISFWYSATDVAGSGYTTMMGTKDNTGTREGFAIFFDEAPVGTSAEDTIDFWAGNSTVHTVSYTDADIDDGNWHHVVVSYDIPSDTASIYYDGILREAETMDGNGNDSSHELYLGQNGNTSYVNNPFEGSLDEVRIYNRALTSGEVKRLYNLSLPKIAKTPTVISNGLVGHWTFDGSDTTQNTAKDSSGSGKTGTLSGNPTPASGIAGQTLHFDGVDDHIVIDTDLVPTSGTFSAWVRPDTLDTSGQTDGDAYIFAMTDYGNSNRFYILQDDAAFSIRLGSSAETGSLHTFAVGRWDHIALVYGSGNYTMYVNGAVVSESSYSGLSGNCDVNSIGAYRDVSCGLGNTKNFFSGDIDDARFYNSELSADEISRIYNATRPTSINKTRTTDILKDGLTGHWTFDGSVTNTNTTVDVTGGGNDGTYTGSPEPTFGKVGQALQFDGVTDRVNLGTDASSFGVDGSNSRSVSFWMYEDSSGCAVGCGIFQTGAQSTNQDWGFKLHASPSTWRVNYWGTLDHDITLDARGVWTHVVITYNESTTDSIAYVNGAFAGSDTGVTLATAASGGTEIGFWNSGEFVGKIDDFRFYNKALSESEITRLYNLGR